MAKTQDMTKGNIFKLLITFAVPIILTYFLQYAYNAADSLMVGRFCDGNALASVGTSEPVCNILITFFLGIGSGASVVVARAFGAGDNKGVFKAVHTSIAISIACGLTVSLLGVFGAPVILRLLNTDAAIFDGSVLYMRIYFIGGLFNIVYNIGAGILRAVGDSKHPLMFLVISALANVVLNYLLIAIIPLGVAGAAIATIASQFLSSFLVILTLVRSRDVHRLFIKDIGFDKEKLKAILKIGVPTGLQGMVISLSNVIIQAYINDMGAAATAGSTAASKVDNFILMFTQSISLALMTFASQNFGAGNEKRAKKGLTVALVLAAGIMLVFGSVISIFREDVVSLFVEKNDPNIDEIIYYGSVKVFFVSTFYFIHAFSDNFSAFLRAKGKAIVPMITYMLTMCLFRILWVTVLRNVIPFVDGDSAGSLFAVYPLSFVLTITLLLSYYLISSYIEKKKKKPEE